MNNEDRKYIRSYGYLYISAATKLFGPYPAVGGIDGQGNRYVTVGTKTYQGTGAYSQLRQDLENEYYDAPAALNTSPIRSTLTPDWLKDLINICDLRVYSGQSLATDGDHHEIALDTLRLRQGNALDHLQFLKPLPN